MSKHNYSQYSKKKNDTAVEPIVEVNEPAQVELVEETVDTVTLPETVDGIVINCAKLNVRANPSLDAAVICVLDAMSEIMVDVNKSVDDWYYVYTATGTEGYCMRKFVDAYL